MATRENIEKISSLKNRDENKKMSIIAPSFERIEERFILENKDFLYQHFKKLPATTFIIEPKENYKELLLYGNNNDTTL
jgi:tRNA A37 threonylcarbamoyladenosine synthetase subunit TsaC/SUA5/YrdC